MIPYKTQYLARPPDMSNTAPVLNELAAEQSDKTIPATSATLPRRFSGLAVTMVFTTSGPNLRMSSVSIGPSATQFTRMSVSQTSRDMAFVNAITPALAAEYAARIHGRLRTRRLLAKSSYFATELMASPERSTGQKIEFRITLFAAALEAVSDGEEQTQTGPEDDP